LADLGRQDARPGAGAEPIELEDRACPLGCAAGDAPVQSGRDRLYGLPGEFRVVRCRGCGLMRTNPRPSLRAMAARYPADYAPHRLEGPHRRRGSPLLRRLFAFETRSVPPLPPGRMLEIGCAAGAFLDEMAGRGWSVEGIEFSEAAAAGARGRGHRVHAGPLESAPAPAVPYDLVVGWMVLEHLHEPVDCLRRLHAWSRPQGWLAVSVPNCASLERRLFGEDWYALHLPNHLFHYTPATLGLVFERAGWRVERVRHQRLLSNLAGSAALALQRRGRAPRLAASLLRIPQRPGAFAYGLYPLAWLLAGVGQTGRMTVWATRR
jgi:2-polyprenyl-3-methyl-5-hydroxy-6-metoxy-1,4-benzoquinol methylase